VVIKVKVTAERHELREKGERGEVGEKRLIQTFHFNLIGEEEGRGGTLALLSEGRKLGKKMREETGEAALPGEKEGVIYWETEKL